MDAETVQISEGEIRVIRYQGYSARTYRLLSHYGVLSDPKIYLSPLKYMQMLFAEKTRLNDKCGKRAEIDFF
ncbi:MAG: hypothetical protein AABX51_09040 [Nanoarchaeota archaeon]